MKKFLDGEKNSGATTVSSRMIPMGFHIKSDSPELIAVCVPVAKVSGLNVLKMAW
jgi:hypothetical protein